MKTSRADLRRALEELGRRPVPARQPSAAFVDDLEARLLASNGVITASHADVHHMLESIAAAPVAVPSAEFVADLERRLLDPAPAAEPAPVAILTPRERRSARLVPVFSVAAAAVAALVLFGALSGFFGGGDTDPDLALASSVDTTVTLPDGTRVSGRDGMDLPDGTVIRTGPNGRASAGGVELGPGLVAVVVDGRLRLRTSTSTGTPEEPTSGTQPPATNAPSGSAEPPAPPATQPPMSAPADQPPPGGGPSLPITVPSTPVITVPTVPSLPPVTLPPIVDRLPELPPVGPFGGR